MPNFSQLKSFATLARNSIGALSYALKHPKVSLFSKILIVIAIAYALSPIDLIPDFIPFAGYLDDTIIIPLLIVLAIKTIPPDIYQECKINAQQTFKKGIRFAIIGILLILLVWGIVTGILLSIVYMCIRLI